jgi:hypothetical protein
MSLLLRRTALALLNAATAIETSRCHFDFLRQSVPMNLLRISRHLHQRIAKIAQRALKDARAAVWQGWHFQNAYMRVNSSVVGFEVNAGDGAAGAKVIVVSRPNNDGGFCEVSHSASFLG